MGTLPRLTRLTRLAALVGLVLTLTVPAALAGTGSLNSGGVGRTASQEPPFADGSLVQAPDGTLHVVEGGYLHRIQPMPASAAQLAAMPIGDPVITGVAIIPLAGPVSPCGEAYSVRVCVQAVVRPYQGDFGPEAGLELALIRLRIENQRAGELQIRGYSIALQVRDVNGSTRDWTSGGNTPPIPEPLSDGFLPPGAAREGNVIIAVPAGVPLTHVIWVLQSSPFEAVEAPIP
jgi:hypothetical protein